MVSATTSIMWVISSRRRGISLHRSSLFRDAEVIATLLQYFSHVSQIAVALYPWVEKTWQSLVESDWTTVQTTVFTRNRWLGFAGSLPWVVGQAHSFEKLVDIIYWAWTLPGRDTLLFVPLGSIDAGRIIREFDDDQEDNGLNELRLLKDYPIVASRGYEGRYLRLFSTTIDESRLATAVAQSRERLKP